jgi:undecaprenyl-diphosphatase
VTIAAGHRGRVALLAVVTALARRLSRCPYAHSNESIVDLDLRVEEWRRQMPRAVEWLARPFTWVGGSSAVVLRRGTVAAAALARRPSRGRVLLLGATLGVQVVVAALKSIYGSPRPEAGSPIDLPQSTSFERHAAAGIVLFGALPCARSRARRVAGSAAGLLAAGLLVGVAVGASRVVLNVHFVSDVLAGFCVGLAWLCACLLVRELVTGRSA